MQRKHKGQAIVELAVVLPVLLLIVFGMLDLGRAFYYQEAVANVAREGARYASTHDNASSADIAAAARAEAGALGSSIIVDSAGYGSDAVAGQFARVSVSYQFQLVTPIIQGVVGNSITLRATSQIPAQTSFGN